MKKFFVLLVISIFAISLNSSLVFADTKIDDQITIIKSSYEKLNNLSDKTKLTLDRLNKKGFDVSLAQKSLNIANDDLKNVNDTMLLIDSTKIDQKTLIKKSNDLLKGAKNSIIDCLATTKTLIENSTK